MRKPVGILCLCPSDRTILLGAFREARPQGRVWASAVVMHGPALQNHLQLALAEWDQEVQALATQSSAEPLANGVRFRRQHRSAQDPHAHVRHRPVEFFREDAIPVVDQESVRMVAR